MNTQQLPTLPEPCHEGWDNMHAKDNGRYCDSCDRVVVDFTKHTKAQLADHYQQHNGDVCGHFRRSQVQSVGQPITPGKRYLRILKRFAVAAIIAFGASLFSLDATAQDVVRTMHGKVLNVGEHNGDIRMKVTGTVVDLLTADPLPNTIIRYQVGEEWHKTATDGNGKYEILLTEEQDSLALHVQYHGFNREVVEVADSKKGKVSFNDELTTYEMKPIRLEEFEVLYDGFMLF